MFTLSNANVDRLSALVNQASGIQVSDAKRNVVKNRLGRHLTEMGVRTFREYLERLESDREEQSYLFDLISTNYSYFFREPEHFNFLARVALPPLFAAGADDGTSVRIWSAAAAAGQEAYSIAIEALEARERASSVRGISIFGTDISHAALEKARRGIYPAAAIENVSNERRRRWFQEGQGSFEGTTRVRSEVRRLANFTAMNIVADTPTERFHLIFVRNIMIYFDRETQERLITQLASRLLPGGWLLIGHSENLTSIRHPLVPYDQTIFRQKTP
jgi:chemotaxis protein methyltransferase CheR